MVVIGRLASSLALLAVVAVLPCCNQASEPAKPTTRSLVEGSVASFLKHWNAQDAEALSMLFVEDGVRVVSSDQLPAHGRAAIRQQFETAFTADSPFAGATLSATVLAARDLPDSLALADGTFEVKAKSGETVLKGKWGNLLRITGDQIHLVMESAHADRSLDADRSSFANAKRATPPKADNTNAEKLAPALLRSANRYIAGVGKQDAKLLAAEFVDDGVRVVGSSAAASRGAAEITKAAAAEFAKGSPSEKASLSVTPLGLRSVGPDIVIANGLWEAKDSKGSVVEFGQWGNVMQVQKDGEMKFIMESAGGYAGLEKTKK